MAQITYDVITIGGGLGGAALAKVLAESGKRVLVVERETEFKDRIRGEWMASWGVAETKKLSLYELLLARCAHETSFWSLVGQPLRDIRLTTPQQLPSLTLYHPVMQEVVLAAASSSGAEVWRGATVREVKLGDRPTLSIEREGSSKELGARLIVAADGRTSAARSWGKFKVNRGTEKLMNAGALLDGCSASDDTNYGMLNPVCGRCAFIFPQGSGRARAYLVYERELERLQGAADFDRFMQESVNTGMPAELYSGTSLRGPLASFDMTETWVDHPYRDGLVLIGDAAGSSDPTWGQGLSLTLRDVRVLSEHLLSSDDWDSAARAYAAEHDRYFNVEREVGQWFFDLFLARGTEAEDRRTRALPLLISEPERVPDHIQSGPELPFSEEVRKRFHGEL